MKIYVMIFRMQEMGCWVNILKGDETQNAGNELSGSLGKRSGKLGSPW
jgi:hypothetical protein